MNDRGHYGAPRYHDARAHVGISLFHTVGDRERAIAQIGTGFRQLSTEIMTKAGWRADPYRDASGPLWEWWRLAGIPVLEEWQKFQADQTDSWWARWATNWETYESWEKRLKNLRELAAAKLRELGKRIETAPPSDLPETLPGMVLEAGGKAAEKAGEAAWDVVKIVKWAAVGALAIGGGIALSSLATTLRQGKEPLEHYAKLYRGVRQ